MTRNLHSSLLHLAIHSKSQALVAMFLFLSFFFHHFFILFRVYSIQGTIDKKFRFNFHRISDYLN